jgi:catechol 2,3-dioxygenase-like lactoylglutathione lyase family enzyme
MRNSLHHVHAFASDVDVSVRFYTDVFGGELIELFEVAPENLPAKLDGYF